jgi:fluoride exporter
MFRNLLLVGTGGAAGSMARYGIGYLVNRYLHNPIYPWGTFAINILGSFLIGILFGLTGRSQWLQEWGILLLASGFCGGFTTFSTFALDNINLVQKGQSVIALIYIGLSVVFGLLLCRLGIWLVS